MSLDEYETRLICPPHRRAADVTAELRLNLAGDVPVYIPRHLTTVRIRPETRAAVLADPAPALVTEPPPGPALQRLSPVALLRKLRRFSDNRGWSRS